MRLGLFVAAFALLASPLAAQSVRVLNPDTGLPVFSATSPAPVTATVAPVSSYWYYTSGATPILSNTTTAVTIKAAAGAGVRNYVDSCEVGSTALGATVPFVIKDGSTVIWAARPPTTGWLAPVQFIFVPPLRSTANALLAVATTTADTSGTFDVNCQGHTGS